MSRKNNRELFSFSKLTTFHTCPYSYYLTYIKKTDRKDNVYSFLGKEIHSLLERLQDNEITVSDALSSFSSTVFLSDISGLDFPTENSKDNFIMCMEDYFLNYERIPAEKSFNEEYFEIEIEGVIMRGYIDLYTINGNYIDVYDYKSSSKFSKKSLEEKQIQLIIYAMALQHKYPDKVIRSLNFDMCKYALNDKGTLVERNKLIDTSKRAFVTIPFSEENIQKTKDFIFSTYREIQKKDKTDVEEWKPNVNKFFCKNICSNFELCPHCK